MKTIKKCPACGSTRVTGAVIKEEGKYYQTIKCKKCNYFNKRELKSSERKINSAVV